ncbi:MAG: cohesin domain-containing protein, partial [Bacillota bacterium]|nr:cohesin domain-containing protein [Bacillota bacterium]
GTNSKRFIMNPDFANYSHFMVCDNVDLGIISYYYINDATNEATLFARIDITENVETSTTSLTYSVNTSSELSTYTVTVNGLISNGKSDTYPQLFVNKYKCDLHSFGITCEGNENAVLNGISVNGAEVSPEISLDNTAYTVKTPRSGTVTVNVTGEAGAKYSVYIDDTEIKMLYGDNILPVKVGECLYIISDNGVTSTTYSFEMIANTHTVKLVPTYCTITNAESDGTKTITVSDGSPVSFNVTPVAGYDFDHVSTGASYTNGVVSVADVSSDMIIDVVFVRRVPVSLTVGSATAAQGQTILVPISISENSGATAGAFNINYDPNKLEFISGVRTGCIALGSTGLDAVPGDNTKLGFYFISKNLGMTPITVGGVLLYLQFTVKDTAADGETSVTVTIESSATKHGGIDDLDGERLVNITNGTINLYTPLDGKYIIKTIAAPTGSGTVSAGSRYAQGEQVTITATPATGYSFVYWEATNGTISNTSSSSATYT